MKSKQTVNIAKIWTVVGENKRSTHHGLELAVAVQHSSQNTQEH